MLTLPAIILAAAVTAAPAAPAPQSVGIGMVSGTFCLPVPAQAGNSYPLGTVAALNTGSAGENIVFRAQAIGQPPWAGWQFYRNELPVSPSWISFSSSSASALPGKTAIVTAALNIPASARRGIYVAFITAAVSGQPSPGQGLEAGLGAAAQAYLIFSVGVTSPSCSMPPAAGSPWYGDYQPERPDPGSTSPEWMKKHWPQKYWYMYDIDPSWGCPVVRTRQAEQAAVQQMVSQNGMSPGLAESLAKHGVLLDCHAVRDPAADPRTGGSVTIPVPAAVPVRAMMPQASTAPLKAVRATRTEVLAGIVILVLLIWFMCRRGPTRLRGA